MITDDFPYKVTAAGRVNLIGEHIDYCGGKVMPAALSRGNTVYVRPNGTDRINLSWTTLPDRISLDMKRLEGYRGLKYGNYQAGSAYVWQRAGHRIVGCDLLQDCNLPFGSGLSSSAAIEVSTIAALAAVSGEAFDPVEAALAAQKAESEFAGVNCGIMDQYASACGKKDCVLHLDCKTLECEYLPLRLGEYSLVIIDSKKPRSLSESKYNERRAETEEALSLLQKTVSVSSLSDLLPAQFKKYAQSLPPVLFRRAAHVVEECERVRFAKQAIGAGDIAFLGRLLNASHASLSDLYEVTGRELDVLAHTAQKHSACAGSRMTGAGFGGCTVSLVRTEAVEAFRNDVCEQYYKETGFLPVCFAARISDGITVEKRRGK